MHIQYNTIQCNRIQYNKIRIQIQLITNTIYDDNTSTIRYKYNTAQILINMQNTKTRQIQLQYTKTIQ